MDGSVGVSDPGPCPICGGGGVRTWIARDWNRWRSDRVFEYLKCASCGTTYLGTIPPDLQRYYEDEYHRLPGSENEVAILAERERFKLEIIRRFAMGTRLLEIGPSFGAFAYLARNAGFEVDVVEPDRGCREVLRRLGRIGVFERTDDLKDVSSGTYDVVALWQVFEHLPDAGATLIRVRDLLRPGGIAVIATPNPESLQARLFGRRWAHLDAPRHALLISSGSLRKRAEQIGFSTELVTMADAGSVGWNSFGWTMSLSNLTRSEPVGALLRLIGRAVAFGIQPIERTGGRGASYTAVFRKPA
jgi:2-polyprenyl-3-methyl-5-hydroxy-6-metoxy-1,4-benzoquinol methylase